MAQIQKVRSQVEAVNGWLQRLGSAVESNMSPGLRANKRKLMAGFLECAKASRDVLAAVVESPDIARRCLMTCAQMGWNLGTSMAADAHILAFWDRHRGKKVPTLVVNYHGLERVAYQHPKVTLIQRGSHYANDIFDYSEGTDAYVRHKVAPGDRGQFLGAWAAVHLKDAPVPIVRYMTRAEIDRIREMSPGKNATAWTNHYAQQAEKTVEKRALKTVPRSDSLATALELDNRAEAGEPQWVESTETETAEPLQGTMELPPEKSTQEESPKRKNGNKTKSGRKRQEDEAPSPASQQNETDAKSQEILAIKRLTKKLEIQEEQMARLLKSVVGEGSLDEIPLQSLKMVQGALEKAHKMGVDGNDALHEVAYVFHMSTQEDSKANEEASAGDELF